MQNDGEVIAKENVPVCIMHNRPKAVYQDFIPDVLADLKESVAIGVSAGIPKENMILDPGVGFAKSYEDNLEVLRHLKEFHALNMPLLHCNIEKVRDWSDIRSAG